MTLEQELKNTIKGEVCNDRKTLEAHSTDASLFKVMPTLVVYPKGVDDVIATIQIVKRRKESGEDVSITARSAGIRAASPRRSHRRSAE
jgi:hypothetical protein